MLHACVLLIGLAAVAQWLNTCLTILWSRVQDLPLLLVPGARKGAQNSNGDGGKTRTLNFVTMSPMFDHRAATADAVLLYYACNLRA